MSNVMNAATATLEQKAPSAFHFYREALQRLQSAGIPFLLGGAYALSCYTGITRHTKDLDLFIRPEDVERMLAVLRAVGYRTELVFSHWLAKAFHGDDFVDVIFSSGNGMCPVDDTWFDHAIDGDMLGVSVRLVPAEEMIWQKAFIMERERFDGADVLHLLRARGRHFDWERLLARFGPHWRVLFSHLILFGFVYPDDQESIPGSVLQTLSARLHEKPAEAPAVPPCQGALLSRMQYLLDIEEWGYADPRLQPLGPMTGEQIIRWTDAGR
jgi:hypothetical protein